MNRPSLRLRLVIVSSVVTTLILAAIVTFQNWQSARIADRILDNLLLGRASEVERRHFFRRSPGSGFGRGDRPDNGPGPGFGQGQNPEDPGPPMRPDSGIAQTGAEPPGQGRPKGPPPDGPMSRLTMRVLNLQGKVLMPPDMNAPLNAAMFEKSKQGMALQFATIVNDGVPYRILSKRSKDPSGKIEIIQVMQENSSRAFQAEAQRWSFLTVLPGVLLAGLSISWLVSKFATDPVKRLTVSAAGLASDPFAEPIPETGDGEIRTLAETLNSMTRSLQEANRASSAALEQQKRLSSDAAHELRTPLTGITLAVDNALHTEATSAEKDQALRSVKRLSEGMTRLTNMLLALARLDANSDQLETSIMNLKEVAEEALMTAGLIDDPRIRWDAADDAHVETNRDAVLQILRNFFDNAARYTPEEGTITIRTSPDSLSVTNSGSVIPAEHLPHVFDRFYRADTSRNRATGNYGLGLAIAKSLADSAGLTLKVDSDLNLGTTFSIIFP